MTKGYSIDLSSLKIKGIPVTLLDSFTLDHFDFFMSKAGKYVVPYQVVEGSRPLLRTLKGVYTATVDKGRVVMPLDPIPSGMPLDNARNKLAKTIVTSLEYLCGIVDCVETGLSRLGEAGPGHVLTVGRGTALILPKSEYLGVICSGTTGDGISYIGGLVYNVDLVTQVVGE